MPETYGIENTESNFSEVSPIIDEYIAGPLSAVSLHDANAIKTEKKRVFFTAYNLNGAKRKDIADGGDFYIRPPGTAAWLMLIYSFTFIK